MYSETPYSIREVTITENFGEWHVTVRVGDKVKVLTFEIEKHAVSYAKGHRLRLGLSSTSVAPGDSNAAALERKATPAAQPR